MSGATARALPREPMPPVNDRVRRAIVKTWTPERPELLVRLRPRDTRGVNRAGR